MVAAKQVIDTPPEDEPLVDQEGKVTTEWLRFLKQMALVGTKVRDGAENMDTLTSASTATDTINAWEELRTTLQEIT